MSICREEQIKDEVGKCLQMLDEVYRVFGLSYTAELSTRPESRMGEEAQWDRAETALREALEAQEAKTGHGWKVTRLAFFRNLHFWQQALIHIAKDCPVNTELPSEKLLKVVNNKGNFKPELYIADFVCERWSVLHGMRIEQICNPSARVLYYSLADE